MFRCRVTATISLTPAGKVSEYSLPSGTSSVLVVFETEEGPLQFGATIATHTGGPLIPGAADPRAIVEFLADEAAIYASPGSRFDLWYGGSIGSGTVIDIVGDLDDVGDDPDG